MKSKSNKIRKFIIAALALTLCVISVCVLAACDKDKNQTENYTVTYVYGNYKGAPANLVRPIIDGNIVEPAKPERTGYDFQYWTKHDENTPFNFTKKYNSQNVTLVAKWKAKQNSPSGEETVTLNWQTVEDNAAKYVFEGKQPSSVKKGSTVKFELQISPFYTGEPVVTAGTQTLEKGNDGKYSFVASDEITVTVTGLSYDNTPMTGSGTEKDPYIVMTPAHLAMVASKVNLDDDDTFNTAYFKLGDDIDLKGEALTPIGIDLYYSMMFQGVFDGDGHTISNFTINKTNNLAALFGYTLHATIANINVEAHLDLSTDSDSLFVGGIVAYNFGSDIVGCSYNGSINVSCDANPDAKSVFVGGIVGFMQGDGETAGEAYTGTVSYCYVDADIAAYGSYDANAIGGIVGSTTGVSMLSPTNTFNCTAKVNIDGMSRRAGAIVGWLRDLASVDNCYAMGEISSTSRRSGGAMNGGIVGEAYNESSVAYCLSRVEGVATGSSTAAGYGLIGSIQDAATLNADDRATLLIGNVHSTSGSVTASQTTYSFENFDDVLALMDWSAEEWKIQGDVIIPDAEGRDSVTLKANFVFTSALNGTDEADLADMFGEDLTGYIPITFIFDGDGLNTLTADNGKISYGYFLDPECTKRIPAGFLISGHDLTVYVGFEDYSEVEGEYYARMGTTDVKLVFDDNGMMTMYADGRRANYMYVYNGEYVVVHDAYFAYFVLDISNDTDALIDFRFDFNADGSVKIYDGVLFGDDGRLPAIAAVTGNIFIGKWYAQGQTLTYTFYADGTGEISNGNQFTYTVTNTSISMRVGNTSISGFLREDGTISLTSGSVLSLNKYDEFSGAWESDFNDQIIISFNGVNEARIGDTVYYYNIEDDVLTAEELRAYFNENGMLVLELNGETRILGRRGSYIGVWYDSVLDYTMTLTGIDRDGYGLGYDSYGYSFTYSVSDESVTTGAIPIQMYYRTSYYGFGSLATGKADSDLAGMELLEMAVFTPASGFIVDDYNLTYRDKFYGVWNSTEGMTLNFNGNGGYDFDIQLSSGRWTTQGWVTVTEGASSERVRYYYDRATVSATFTYKDKEYTVEKFGNSIKVSDEDGTEYSFSAPDVLGLNAWYADGIAHIQFNGKGNVGCGVVTMTSDEGVKNTYTYEYEADEVTVKIFDNHDELVYTLSTESMMLYDATGAPINELGMYSPILGKTYVLLGMNVLDLTERLDMEGDGVAMFNDIQLYLMYVDEDMLLMYDSTFSLVFYLVWFDENTVLVYNDEGELVNIAAVPDDMFGVYSNEDMGLEIAFDGITLNGINYDAEAEMYEIDENGEQISESDVYVYAVISGNYVLGGYDEDDEFVPMYVISFEEVEDGIEFTSEDGVSIWLVAVDND